MTAISEKFHELSRKGKHGLIGYVVAGYPDPDTTIEIVNAMVKGGVDVVELGIPFSDPIADGPVIQKASYEALVNGITPAKALELARRIKDQMDVPLALMTYYNVFYKPGFDKFLEKAKEQGIDGLIVPDLAVEESSEFRKAAKNHALDTIFLVSPNTSESRLKAIVKATSGFLYLVSVFGTTGERSGFESYTKDAIKHVKKHSKQKIPLAVGFGVSNRDHVKFMIDNGADAVIVGSAFIKIVDQNNGSNRIMKIEEFTRDLKNVRVE